MKEKSIESKHVCRLCRLKKRKHGLDQALSHGCHYGMTVTFINTYKSTEKIQDYAKNGTIPLFHNESLHSQCIYRSNLDRFLQIGEPCAQDLLPHCHVAQLRLPLEAEPAGIAIFISLHLPHSNISFFFLLSFFWFSW